MQLLEKRLVGVSPDDGHLLWQSEFPGRVAVIPTPIVKDNQVFGTAGYGAGCTLVEISPDNTPTEKYDETARKLMKNHHGGVILPRRQSLRALGRRRLDLHGLRHRRTEMARARMRSSKGAIAYADGMFYCLGEDDGQVVLIDASPEGWQEHGRFTLDPQTKIRSDRGKIWTHPVIANGKMYLRDQDLMYCYDVKAK